MTGPRVTEAPPAEDGKADRSPVDRGEEAGEAGTTLDGGVLRGADIHWSEGDP